MIDIIHGDCRKVLPTYPDNHFDSLLTDPPGGIEFLGMEWDTDKGGKQQWVEWLTGIMQECLRVLKPGAHGLVWGFPRTLHWTMNALEDAGFETKSIVTHHYSSGFPKSKDVSKKMENGEQWRGWRSSLKPATEFYILVRKPLSEPTIVANVLKWSTGLLNIDQSRIHPRDRTDYGLQNARRSEGHLFKAPSEVADFDSYKGRFPSDLVLTHHHDCKKVGTDRVQSGGNNRGHTIKSKRFGYDNEGCPSSTLSYADADGKEEIDIWRCHPNCPVQELNLQGQAASRFYYCSKTSPKEKYIYIPKEDRVVDYREGSKWRRSHRDAIKATEVRDVIIHPTQKPLQLMRYFVKLITPPGGTVLDAFCGSGAIPRAALLEEFNSVGIDSDEIYCRIARHALGVEQEQIDEQPSTLLDL